MMMMNNELIKREAPVADTLEHRNLGMSFERSGDGAEATYIFPLSSETPVPRWRGNEILVHDKKSVDLTFLNSGRAPLLYQHNSWSGQIGVILKAWLDAKRVYVEVKFSRRPEAQAVKMDVDDDIMRNVSIGYNVSKVEHTERDDDLPSEYRVTQWKPMEASIVSIPADETVGVGRANQLNMEGIMPNTNPVTPAATPQNGGAQGQRASGGLPSGTPPADGVIAGNVLSDEARAAEIADQMSEITALGRSHNRADEAAAFIEKAMRAGAVPSLAAYRGELRMALPDDVPLVNNDIGISNQEAREFSIVRLARTFQDGARNEDYEAAAFEMEATEAAARNFNGQTNGARLPEEIMRNWSTFGQDGVRAPMATTAHPNVQTVDHLANRFIDNLRNQSAILRAGVTILPGLDSNVEIPGGDTNSAAAWLAAEGDDAAETNPTFRKITLSVKDIAGRTEMTRRMLMQSTISMEMYVRTQLLTAIVLGIDLAGLQGSGAAGVPEGIKNTTGIGSATFAAAQPTRDEIIDMRTEVAGNNALLGNLHFLSNSNMVGGFLKTKLDAGSGRFLMENDGDRLIGHSNIESNQVTDGDLFFGNWSDMLMGMWGGLDLDRDTSILFKSGGIMLRAIQSVDFGVQRVGSFVLGNDGV